MGAPAAEIAKHLSEGESMLVRNSSSGRVEKQSPTVRIASLNVAGKTDVDLILDGLRAIDGLSSADVLLLQEAEYSSRAIPRSIREVARALGMRVAYAAESENPDGTAMALATLSPHKLIRIKKAPLQTFKRVFFERDRIALATTVKGPFGRMRVVNVHMDTRINADQRAVQIQSALRLFRGFRGPRVIGGDFNTADVRWYRHVVPWRAEPQGQLIKLHLEREGFETPFDGTQPTVRFWRYQLDWIFLNGLKALTHSIRDVAFSDHSAVWVDCAVPTSGTA